MSTILGADYVPLGPDVTAMLQHILGGGLIAGDIKALNTGVAFRFRAFETADIKTVNLAFTSVDASTRIKVEIWTIDATTGKPNAIYDANATFTTTVALTANALNQFTFAVTPTAGLTVGNEYAVVIVTTTGGATTTGLCMNVGTGGHFGSESYQYLTSADAGSTWTYNTAACINPCSLIDENSKENSIGFYPFISATGSGYIYLTSIIASKIVLNTSQTVRGVWVYLRRVGTPAGALRCRIVDNSNNLVTNADVTLDIDSLVNHSAANNYRTFLFPFTTMPQLNAGTYRILFSSPDSADTSNCWRMFSVQPFTVDSAQYAAGQFSAGTSAGADAIPGSWTDSATYNMVPVRLLVDAFSSSGRPELRGANL